MNQPQTEYDIYKQKALDVLHRTKSVSAVREFIESISDDDYRDHTFLNMAVYLAKQGDFLDAVGFCECIRRPLERADAFTDVAREVKNFKGATLAKDLLKKAIKAVNAGSCDPWEATAVWLGVANDMWLLEERDEAIALVEKSVALCENQSDPIAGSKTLAGCARALTRWGKLQRALEIAQLVEPATLRSLLLEELQRNSKLG